MNLTQPLHKALIECPQAEALACAGRRWTWAAFTDRVARLAAVLQQLGLQPGDRVGMLGMNSDHTVFDHVIMDPELTATVPRDQYFHTGMDAYIHCIESLGGSYRNAIGDAYSRETINLCRQVFGPGDMMAPDRREQLMVAAYLGGCAIATSYVGVVHPLSAGLSVVLGIHHCVGNCIVMRAMRDFYPAAYDEFWGWVDGQRVRVATHHRYILLNKPRGCMTTRRDPEGRPTVLDLKQFLRTAATPGFELTAQQRQRVRPQCGADGAVIGVQILANAGFGQHHLGLLLARQPGKQPKLFLHPGDFPARPMPMPGQAAQRPGIGQ